MLRIGVDVGGTNTDAAVMRGGEVLATVKALTTSDVTSGCEEAIAAALREAAVDACDVQAIMVGTTHFINALLTKKGLAKCAVLRLCGGATGELPPFVDLADGLATEIGVYARTLPGGMHHDGVSIAAVDTAATQLAVREAIAAGATAFVVSGVFSPVSAHQEDEACAVVANELRAMGCASALVTKSADVAGLGILERENAAVLNAALRPMAQGVVKGTQEAFRRCGCGAAKLFFTQNDGTVMRASEAARFPIRCVQCGPVNSLRGAALLAGVSDAIVVDVGGTSTDVGAIVKGFPRPASCDAFIGDVRTNYPVPDVVCVGLGGGSLVEGSSVGPASLGSALPTECLARGGRTCTATDVAIRRGKGPDDFGSSDLVEAALSAHVARDAWRTIQSKVARAVDQCRTSAEPVRVVLVGGGAFLVEDSLQGASEVLRPLHAASANAVGAAAAQVSGTVDAVVRLGTDEAEREKVLGELKAQAVSRAYEAGAMPTTVSVLEVDLTPLAYLPGGACRAKIRAVGDLDVGQEAVADTEFADDPGRTAAHVDGAASRSRSGAVQETPQKRQCVEGPDPADVGRHADHQAVSAEWELGPGDIGAIALGVGVLGAGGGGSPNQSKLALQQAMRGQRAPKIVSPDTLPDDCLVFAAGVMGAPTVGVEMLRGGQTLAAIRALAAHLRKEPSYVISAEIGGANGLEQLVLATRLGVPAVDGDLMGRAFPCLDHVTSAIYGLGVAPAALADHQGNVVLVPAVASAKAMEDILRPVCSSMGCTAGLAMRPLTGAEVKRVCIRHTVSQALRIGRAVHAARLGLRDPVSAAACAGGGRVLFVGKVTDVRRATSDGFAKGALRIEGVGGDRLEIDFQNENLVAALGGRVVATTPELICVLETATGRPLQTEDTRYGQLVSVVLLPAPALLRTPQALGVIGPRAFGYGFDFVSSASAAPSTGAPRKDALCAIGPRAFGYGFGVVSGASAAPLTSAPRKDLP